MNKLIFSLAAIFAIALLFGCTQYGSNTNTNTGNTSGTTSPPAGSSAVNIQNMAFAPQSITVPIGTTVVWTNNDSVTHTVTSDSGAFDSGNLAPGKTYSHTFDGAGSFTYHCAIHTFMTGTAIVQ